VSDVQLTLVGGSVPYHLSRVVTGRTGSGAVGDEVTPLLCRSGLSTAPTVTTAASLQQHGVLESKSRDAYVIGAVPA
jgi:hypothetical protein